MPIYEYVCKHCGHRFERFQRMTDASIQTCPQCAGAVSRVIQPVGVIFKGSGFYVTDHARGSNGNGASGAGHKPSTEAASNGKSAEHETKGAGKAEGEKPAKPGGTT